MDAWTTEDVALALGTLEAILRVVVAGLFLACVFLGWTLLGRVMGGVNSWRSIGGRGLKG